MSKHLYHHEAAALTCTHVSFFDPTVTQAQKCQLAQTGCDDQFDFVNFFMVSYCWLGGSLYVSLPLSFLVIFFIFRFVSSVVEEYLAPAIAYISEYLKMPEALAAVTLLALANGAGDVITALVASGSSGGLAYNIGSIYGAGLFVTSIVVAMTINNSPNDIQLEPNSIWRDVGFYILATLSVIGFAVIGELTPVSACIMLGEYVLLVLLVWWQESQKPKEEEEGDKEKDKEDPSPKKPQVDKKERLQQNNLIAFEDDKTDEERKAESKKWKQTLSKINTVSPAKRMKMLTQQFRTVIYMAMKNKMKQEEKEGEFKDLDLFGKILFITDQPFNYARKLTLPPCEPEKYEKLWAVIFPAPGLLFILFAMFLEPKIWWLSVVPVGLLVSFLIHRTSEESEPPKYYFWLELFGAVGALMWTYLVSGILIDLLNYLGMVSKLDTTYMGLTVIAVGNALPDAVTTIALAKQGYAMMGLTGAYAGQLFGLLVGFGLALLKKTLQEGNQPFNLFSPAEFQANLMSNIVIQVSLLNLVITFIFGIANKYRFNRLLAKIIGVLYVTFVSGSTILAVYKAMQ